MRNCLLLMSLIFVSACGNIENQKIVNLDEEKNNPLIVPPAEK